jgi:hypothetical protein
MLCATQLVCPTPEVQKDNVSARDDQKREAWFRRGVEALARARPDAPKLYCCPFCIQGFPDSDPEYLSFEDVPPRSVGGKPLVLTCRKCNNTHGSDLDSHIAAGSDLRDIVAGESTTWAKLRLGDAVINTRARLGSENVEVVEAVEKTDPKMSEAFASELERRTSSGSRDWKLTLAFSARHDPWREDVAWLRVAYLYLFALLGYNFIMRSVLEPIRSQFQNPDEHLVEPVLKRLTEYADVNRIMVVHGPRHLSGFAVQLGRRLFFLPGFVECGSFYERLAELPPKGRLDLAARQLETPQGPEFICDYHPESMAFLASLQLGGVDDA